MKISPPFGIDLGTTRSVAAALLPDAAEPVVASDDEDRTTLPSVLASAGEDRWHAGHRAIEASRDGQADLIESVKRRIGSEQPLADAPQLTAEEASAVILSAVSQRMTDYVARTRQGRPELTPTHAVVTVPAYFDAPQIEATRRAGTKAGLTVGGLVQEPTAAAIYHTWHNGLGDGTYLVYDLGGGTFDVSIIRALYGEYQVLSIDGDNHLGGDDFDRRLADRWRRQLADDGCDLGDDVDTEADRTAFEALRRVARRTKEKLSDTDEVTVDEAALFEDRSGRSVDLQTTVDRTTFESAIDDLIESTIIASRRAVDTATNRHDIEADDIDGIFLVGGSTRVPAVRHRLAESIGADLDVGDDQIVGDHPETSVARGAALHAAATCPCRFQSDDITASITDFPSDTDDHLMGEFELSAPSTPTDVVFGADPNTDADADRPRRATLEGNESPFRFSLPKFDATGLHPVDSPMVSTVLRRAGDDLTEPFELWLPNRPDGARPVPTLALTNPSVLAKDINVEIVDDGQPSRYTLVPRGTHLPTTVDHQLVVGDESGALILRLFQHRLPIHTIAIPLFDDVSTGTPIELTVDIDEAMNMTASGTVGDRQFEATIDRPSAPRRRQWDEIEKLIDRIDDVGDRLWGVEQRRFHKRATNIRTGIRAAVRHDPRRLQVLARRLEALLDDYAPDAGRSPGRGRLDKMLDTIRRLVFISEQDRLGRSRDEWQPKLQKLADDVDDAWESDDDTRWHTVADRVQALYESVAQDEFMYRRRNPERYAQTLYDTTDARLDSFEQRLDQFNFASDDEARRLQKSELDSIRDNLSDLRNKLPDSPPTPDDVSDLERLARSVNHLERRLERVRTLGLPRSGES